MVNSAYNKPEKFARAAAPETPHTRLPLLKLLGIIARDSANGNGAPNEIC
jgi:hypothetical protein